MGRHIHAHICPKHGYKQGAKCDECVEMQEAPQSPAIRTDSWIEGMWEHIDTKPIYIRNKQHLYEECTKRGQIPKAFMKPKSQGKGMEFKWR